MMWLKCIACDIYVNPRMYKGDRQDFIYATRRCPCCFSNNTLHQLVDPFDDKYFPDNHTYAFLDICRMCEKVAPVSSGTASCFECDKDPFDSPINHGDFYDEHEEYIPRIR